VRQCLVFEMDTLTPSKSLDQSHVTTVRHLFESASGVLVIEIMAKIRTSTISDAAKIKLREEVWRLWTERLGDEVLQAPIVAIPRLMNAEGFRKLWPDVDRAMRLAYGVPIHKRRRRGTA